MCLISHHFPNCFDQNSIDFANVSYSPFDKISDIFAAKMEPRGTLIGSNAAINSVDFDTTGSMVLATSNDYAT